MAETPEQRIARLVKSLGEHTDEGDIERFATQFAEHFPELPQDRLLPAMDAFMCVLAGEPPRWAVELADRLQAEALRMEGSGQADGLLFAAGALLGAATKGGSHG